MKTNAFESVPRLTLLATFTAFIGAVLLFIGIFSAIVSFDHNNAVLPYSFRNHVISELGFPYASQLTWLFNGTVMLGGLMLLPTNYALGAHLRTRLGYAAASFGCLAGLALSGLGMFGLRQDFLHERYLFASFFRIHMAIADAFFLGWTMAITLFTILFCRRWKDPASRMVALAGIVFMVIFFTLLVVTICLNPAQAAAFKDFKAILDSSPTSSPVLSQWLDSHRPPVFWQAVSEWAWAGSVLLWHGIALVFLWRKTREVSEHFKVIAEQFSHEIVA